MQLAIPKWKGLLSALAWVVLAVALWCTIVGLVSIIVRAVSGGGGFFSLFRDRTPGEVALAIPFAALPSIVGWVFAVFVQGAIGDRQPWLVRIAAGNVLAAIVVVLIG